MTTQTMFHQPWSLAGSYGLASLVLGKDVLPALLPFKGRIHEFLEFVSLTPTRPTRTADRRRNDGLCLGAVDGMLVTEVDE